jgi:hypothetical protein
MTVSGVSVQVSGFSYSLNWYENSVSFLIKPTVVLAGGRADT